MNSENLIEICQYNEKLNEVSGANLPVGKIIYRSVGLPIHMRNRGHGRYLPYIDKLEEILQSPDYVGVNPNEPPNSSIELVKRYDDNIFVGIKLDIENDYLYVSTIFGIQEQKIQRRLHSHRLKEFNIDNS